MKVTVEYAAQVKRVAGQRTETWEFDSPCTVQSVLDRIVETHGDTMREILLSENAELHPSILLFLGDDQLRNEPARELSDGDVLTILSPISGG